MNWQQESRGLFGFLDSSHRHLCRSSRCNAQRACSATAGSSSSANFRSVGANSSLPLFPMAVTTLRRTPFSLARLIGDLRKAHESRRHRGMPASPAQGSRILFAVRIRFCPAGALGIPRAHVLAYITAKDVPPHPFSQIFGNRALLLDRQISDAARRVKFIRGRKGVGRAGVEAARACSATVRRRRSGCKPMKSGSHLRTTTNPIPGSGCTCSFRSTRSPAYFA